jgi:hypothetical protein
MPLYTFLLHYLSLNPLKERQIWPVTDTVSIFGTEMSCLYLITSGISFSFLMNKWQCGSLYISFNYLEAAVSYQSSFLCSYSGFLKKTGCWKSHSTNLNGRSTYSSRLLVCPHKGLTNPTLIIMYTHKYTYSKY